MYTKYAVDDASSSTNAVTLNDASRLARSLLE
jgi:hypothetical protein